MPGVPGKLPSLVQLTAVSGKFVTYIAIAEVNSLHVTGMINRENPDLLVLDLWRPVMSGDQVLGNARGNPNTKNLPVLVISASGDGRHLAMNAGPTDFVAKPFDLEQLLARVKLLLHAA